MYDHEIRMAYDKGIKEFKIYEQGENYFVYRGWYNSPMMFVSERDLIDKRISFSKDGIYYSFSSSIDNFQPTQDKVVRIYNFLNTCILSEDDQNFYFNSYSQLDAKVANFDNNLDDDS